MDGGVSTVLMKSQKQQDVKEKPAQYPFRFSGDNKKMLEVRRTSIASPPSKGDQREASQGIANLP
jgi:hypothetical protein